MLHKIKYFLLTMETIIHLRRFLKISDHRANNTDLPDEDDDEWSSNISSDSDTSDDNAHSEQLPPGYNVAIRWRENTD